MHQNVLPGQQRPYFLESGEGQRYLVGPLHATTIARRQDTGSLMEGTVLLGARNSVVPLHRHNNSHEAIYVLEGSASLRLDDKEFALEGGDYASVPAGTVHSFTFASHRTRLLTWTFGDSGGAVYAALGQPSEAVTYSARAVPD